MDIKSRLEYLQNLGQFIKFHENNIKSILSTVEWTEEGLLEPSDKKRQRGDDIMDETSSPVAGPSTQSVKKTDIIYEEIMASLPQKTQDQKEKTLLDLLSEERDQKRRRMSYKGKIHTKNKSHTEVMKEVIEQQMEALQGYRDERTDEVQPPVEEVKKQDLFQVKLPKHCNPHTAWKNVHKYIENFEKVHSSDDDLSEKQAEEKSFDCLQGKFRSDQSLKYKHNPQSNRRRQDSRERSNQRTQKRQLWRDSYYSESAEESKGKEIIDFRNREYEKSKKKYYSENKYRYKESVSAQYEDSHHRKEHNSSEVIKKEKCKKEKLKHLLTETESSSSRKHKQSKKKKESKKRKRHKRDRSYSSST